MSPVPAEPPTLGWLAICRLGLVQAALGAVVVVITSTLNRVMVVEYALPAVLPGLLVALQYAVQFVRPRFGFESDIGARRTPWIIGGMAVLAGGGVLCTLAVGEIAFHPWAGLALAAAAYALAGLGVGAAGTSLLVLVANRVGERRAAAATIMWILMIAGFAVTSTAVGHFLDPFSPQRLLLATLAVAAAAFSVTLAALWNIERLPVQTRSASDVRAERTPAAPPTRAFLPSLKRVWSEPKARNFTLFVFISMLAYSAQELLLEPFAGLVFGYSLGASAQLSGLWHAAALAGMIGVGVACSGARRVGGARRLGSLRGWTLGGCIGSGVALLSLAVADWVGPLWPLRLSVMALGAANGAFAVAAIASMMELSHADGAAHAGVRMGLWGAAQAVAFALGGLMGAAIVDVTRNLFGSPAAAFAIVFTAEAALFFLASRFVGRSRPQSTSRSTPQIQVVSL